ncbi:MAG: sigma-54-dependent Fis family transcriptional regulator [Deltaproteobacteria bacterium]|nr:sigma-54-dependent Fis family transcriptional regulator [Deltaproteobacteria bacterium]
MKTIKVLTVDNMASACDYLTKLAEALGFQAVGVTGQENVVPVYNRMAPDLVVIGPGVNNGHYTDFVRDCGLGKKAVPMIFIGARDVPPGQTAVGARPDIVCLSENFRPDALKKAIEDLVRRSAYTGNAQTTLDAMIVGQTPAMTALKRHILQVCDSDLTVLISGESGTGKEVVARAIHRLSPRADKPFVKVNSAGLPDHLFESELFGYEKGAFTGAYKSKPGKFRLAHRGTILLDEIGEISLALQAKLLQVLEDSELSPLGSVRTTPIDTRVLAATNARLDEMVTRKQFRLDLFYRLSVISIRIPPLRERKEDIPLLSEHFLRKYAAYYNKPCRYLSEEVCRRFYQYDWPGNVRQLENAVRCFVALGSPDPVLPGPSEGMRVYTLKEVCREAVRRAEKRVIEQVLWHTDWNRKKAASLLKTSYRNLLNKIKEYDIEPEMAAIHPAPGTQGQDPWAAISNFQPSA